MKLLLTFGYMKLILFFIFLFLFSCTRTTYHASQGPNQISLSPKKPNEVFVRNYYVWYKEVYLFFGLVSVTSKRDIYVDLGLKPNQSLVNIKITNKKSFADGFLDLVSGLFSFGIVPIILLTMRTTEIRGEIVEEPPSPIPQKQNETPVYIEEE